MSSIAENTEIIKERISGAAKRAGRKESDVLLIGVSKKMSEEKIIQAKQAGITAFGENYVQEFLGKYENIPDFTWHFIGHLQKNKVKYLIGKCATIQSVDSVELLLKINEVSAKSGIITPILIELNVAEEKSKFGLTINQTPYIIDKAESCPFIQLRGLMTIAPFVENPEDNRPVFFKMRECFEKYASQLPDFDSLSMGMSGDYEVAVEEGATMVRIGTSIFGARA